MKSTSKPGPRACASRRVGLYLPSLETLEDRLQPGESLLGWLVGGALLGPSLSVLDSASWVSDNGTGSRVENPGPAPHGTRPEQDLDLTAGPSFLALATVPEDRNVAPSRPLPTASTQALSGTPATLFAGTDDGLTLPWATPLPQGRTQRQDGSSPVASGQSMQ